MPKKKKSKNNKSSQRAASASTMGDIFSSHIVSAYERKVDSDDIPADKKTITDILSVGEWYLKSAKGKNNTFERKVIMEDGSLKRQTTSLSKTPSTKNAYKDQKKQLLRDEYWEGTTHIVIAAVAQAL